MSCWMFQVTFVIPSGVPSFHLQTTSDKLGISNVLQMLNLFWRKPNFRIRKGWVPTFCALELACSWPEAGALPKMLILAVCLPYVMLNVSSDVCNTLWCSSFPFADYLGQTRDFECTLDAVYISKEAQLSHYKRLSPNLIRIGASL
jgi:hypothetical protein